MHLLIFLAVAVGVCRGATYNTVGWQQNCDYPTWTCDCRLAYDCKSNGRFPSDVGADSATGYIKDLAPDYHPLLISGKRWRKSARTQEAFCKRECSDRMNAFMCLEDGLFSDYSYTAVCLKFLDLAAGPLALDGTGEPCCAIWLEYGVQGCTRKWTRLLDTVRCLARTIDASFDTNTAAMAIHRVFSSEGGCDPTAGLDFTWCTAAPTCIAI